MSTLEANIQLSEASGVPFYRQILDQLAEAIRRGELPAGTPLPSVRALARELLVSVITTRRAYSELEQLGLVERRQGKGTFVHADVRPRARRLSNEHASAVLREAIANARALGLDTSAIRQLVEQALEGSAHDE